MMSHSMNYQIRSQIYYMTQLISEHYDVKILFNDYHIYKNIYFVGYLRKLSAGKMLSWNIALSPILVNLTRV